LHGHLLPQDKNDVDVLALGTELLHLHLLKVTTFVNLEETLTNINFIDDNPLWDGQGCVAYQQECCKFNNPPTFCKQLDQPTAEDIEIRIMGSVNEFNTLEEEDTPVELLRFLFNDSTVA
jgi:hypothetical protein